VTGWPGDHLVARGIRKIDALIRAPASSTRSSVIATRTRVGGMAAPVTFARSCVAVTGTRFNVTGAAVALARARIEAKGGPFRATGTPLQPTGARVDGTEWPLPKTGRRNFLIGTSFDHADSTVPLLAWRLRSVEARVRGLDAGAAPRRQRVARQDS
jgi:hypothetical protein